ncbi:MAG TPA: lysylphosphatidylglycerol synthase domain-containing protein [Nitrobacter sp.]|nr:lysylphosphatidylglycerol synthase domain-containing protein [Nitrobacter sp.]
MKPGLRFFGAAIAVAAGAYFVTYTYRSLVGQDLSHLLQPRVLFAGAALTVLYSLLIPFTALAWAWLLRGLGKPVGFSVTGPILATTQFGKYLPGNITHHLGRLLISKRHGVGTPTTILSMAYETLLTVVACTHVSALTLLWTPPAALANWPLAAYRGPLIVAVSVGAIGVMIAAPRLAGFIARRRLRGDSEAMAYVPTVHPGWGTALGCYLLYVLNFALVGAGLWLVGHALSFGTDQSISPILLIGAFASSWILGFLAPGAPAGLGVREAVLAVWLGGSLGPSVTAALIVMLRIATTLGDLLNFVWGNVTLARLRLAAKNVDRSNRQHQNSG